MDFTFRRARSTLRLVASLLKHVAFLRYTYQESQEYYTIEANSSSLRSIEVESFLIVS